MLQYFFFPKPAKGRVAVNLGDRFEVSAQAAMKNLIIDEDLLNRPAFAESGVDIHSSIL